MALSQSSRLWAKLGLSLMACLLCLAEAWANHPSGDASGRALTGPSAEPLSVGILAYRTPAVMTERFGPLVAYLSEQLEGRPVELLPLDHDALRRAALARRLDVILTNPGYALELRHQIGTVTYLGTLITSYQGQAARSLGGVLVAAAGRTDLRDWSDLNNLRIGVGGSHMFGGYHVHAYEMLQRGLPYPGKNQLVTYPGQEDALRAALAGEVDVAQVRSGLLEQLTAEGRLQDGTFHIVAPQALEGFPYHVSTRLYPEWPVMALPHVDGDLQRRLAAALLSLPPDHPAAQAAGLAGVAPPVDYGPVERMAQALGVPPYDVPAPVSLRQVWGEYRLWVLALAGTAGVLLLFTVLLWFQRRRLLTVLAERRQLMARIETDAERQHHLLGGSPSVIYALAPDSLKPTYVGRNVLTLLGVDPDVPVGDRQWWRSTVHPQDLSGAVQGIADWMQHGCEGQLVQIYRMRHQEGHWVWVENRLRARRGGQGQVVELVGAYTDCSERMAYEQILRLNASVFAHAREGIVICDVQANIVDVNPSFTRITGYAREDVLGRNPRLLQSGRQDAEFYRNMWRSLVQHGAWEGELLNRKASGELYSQFSTIIAVRNVEGKPTHYVGVFSDITEKKAYESRLIRLAYYDELTGLATRGLLTDRLRQALSQLRRNQGALSVAFLDLDGFKEVNDTLGHAAGDRLLTEVARRLQAALRDGDTVARLGGDEFVVLLINHETQPTHDLLMQRLLHAAADPVSIDGREAHVSASIGVCVCYPEGEADADQVIRQADHAMYAAKLAGKNRYEVFDGRIDDRVRIHRYQRERIAQGLRDGEFVLHYQPKVNMRTGQLLGAEALIRWQHPDQGLLLPGAFLPATEGHPVGLQLGRWVMAEALSQAQRWRSAGACVPVSVNIAPDHLLDAGFVAELVELLNLHPDLPSGGLELEILESTALEDVKGASDILQRCTALGVSAALDDFGTGYSSLTYLKTLPTHTLKIDQSFVRDMTSDPDDLAILQGVLDLARVFRRQVVAEGVETETHGLMLLHLGCEAGQGYGIARPMPAADLLPWSQTWRPPQGWQDVPVHQTDRIELMMEAVHLRQGLQQLRAHLEGVDLGASPTEGIAVNMPWSPQSGEPWVQCPHVHGLYDELVLCVRQSLDHAEQGDREASLTRLEAAEVACERLLAQLLRPTVDA